MLCYGLNCIPSPDIKTKVYGSLSPNTSLCDFFRNGVVAGIIS